MMGAKVHATRSGEIFFLKINQNFDAKNVFYTIHVIHRIINSILIKESLHGNLIMFD